VPQDFISAIRELETSGDEDVLNLAETLGVQAHTSRDTNIRALDRQGEEAAQHERLRRAMSRLSRLDDNTDTAAYGDRVPSQNSLYDWSPAANEAGDEDELDHLLAERSISSRLNSERAGAGESLRSTAILQSVRRHPRFSARTRDYIHRYNSDRERERERERDSRTGTHSESQQRFLDENNRRAAMQRLQESRSNALDRERRDMLSRADSSSINSYRRSYLDHRASTSTSNPAPAVSPLLEETVKYLSLIRQAESIDESVTHALDAGLLGKEHLGNCARDYADFVVDVSTIPPPAQTSWLAPGAVLSGCQHATSVAMPGSTNAHPHPYRVYDASTRAAAIATLGLPPPARPWLANTFNTSRSRTTEPLPQTPQQDQWPVKVTIHEVDWTHMTLSATMEAYNVPSHPHSLPSQAQQQYTRTSSITTYLEGEILDFSQHTLLTESFKSSAATDAMYWRKLPPFGGMSDEEVVRSLTSRRWMRDVLGSEWVLMRWKERCFVKSLKSSRLPLTLDASNPVTVADAPIPSYHTHLQIADGQQHASFDDSGCGLTISGFYYVALRRGDGACEGLYFDPQSSPYQCLRLGSRRGGAVGGWGFR